VIEYSIKGSGRFFFFKIGSVLKYNWVEPRRVAVTCKKRLEICVCVRYVDLGKKYVLKVNFCFFTENHQFCQIFQFSSGVLRIKYVETSTRHFFSDNPPHREMAPSAAIDDDDILLLVLLLGHHFVVLASLLL
jgi:hypothetical protein